MTEQSSTSAALAQDEERASFIELNPSTFHIRHPPPPHELHDRITDEESLFQTIHMGAAVVDTAKWRLSITGLVSNPFSLNLEQLQSWPSKTISSFHECYGSPLVPPSKALRRIGNVKWTGVPLHLLLDHAVVRPEACFVWTEGLDRGTFAKVDADRYQKDLPFSKALQDEVLVAYSMNGSPLSKNRGGPVRLVVPGWFGTNAVKWLCKIDVRDCRAPGPFTTVFYNERFPPDEPECESRPVWGVQPNSMLTRPVPEEVLEAGKGFYVEGWAWSEDGVARVEVVVEGDSSVDGVVELRKEFSWQRFRGVLELEPGDYVVLARAMGKDGRVQPLGEGRNHVHRVPITVK